VKSETVACEVLDDERKADSGRNRVPDKDDLDLGCVLRDGELFLVAPSRRLIWVSVAAFVFFLIAAVYWRIRLRPHS
jgi:hypothetical protein